MDSNGGAFRQRDQHRDPFGMGNNQVSLRAWPVLVLPAFVCAGSIVRRVQPYLAADRDHRAAVRQRIRKSITGITEYNRHDLIYMGFAWSVSDKACELVEELAYKHGLGFFDMFDVHLDRNTVIKIPQVSKEKLNQEENKQGTKHKGLFGWLFGK